MSGAALPESDGAEEPAELLRKRNTILKGAVLRLQADHRALEGRAKE